MSEWHTMFRNGRERAEYGATVTFENTHGETLTISHVGIGPRAALTRACDEALAADETFRVVCISTPESIARDLWGRDLRHGRAGVDEGGALKAAGLGTMLHDRLAARSRERWAR